MGAHPDDPFPDLPCDPNEEVGCDQCGAADPSWCQRPGGYRPPSDFDNEPGRDAR